MRRDRGFSLLELGIVMGVILILLTGIALTTRAAFSFARSERTGQEMQSLARAASDALKRGLVVQPMAGGAPTVSFDYGPSTLILDDTNPICFDLSRAGGSRRCPVDGDQDGAAWSGELPAQAVPANSPLLTALGGTIQNNGFNAWCEPYVLCFYRHRVAALSCVPVDELNSSGLAGVNECGDCAGVSSVTGEPTRCAMTTVSGFSHAASRLRSSYSDPLLYDLPRFVDAPRR